MLRVQEKKYIYILKITPNGTSNFSLWKIGDLISIKWQFKKFSLKIENEKVPATRVDLKFNFF